MALRGGEVADWGHRRSQRRASGGLEPDPIYAAGPAGGVDVPAGAAFFGEACVAA